MHEFHAWFGLAQSPDEDDEAALSRAIDELGRLVESPQWHDAVFELRQLNGRYFLTATGLVNRRRAEGERLDRLVEFVADRLPGSWGMVYERDDEMPDPPGPNGFRVRVLARGGVVERVDPFLSPCRPVIED